MNIMLGRFRDFATYVIGYGFTNYIATLIWHNISGIRKYTEMHSGLV